jgi:hypothetical protein
MIRREALKYIAALFGGVAGLGVAQKASAACSEASCPTTQRQRCCGGRCLTCPSGSSPACIHNQNGSVVAKCCDADSHCTTMYRVS